MHVKFASPIKGDNKGSSTKLVNYLEKENDKSLGHEKEYFFSSDRDKCNKWEVIQQIDNNMKGQKIEAKEDKFYSMVIAPSKQELEYIGNDPKKLKEYTRAVMENYAAGFCDSKGQNRGLQSKDIVWYAKVENERKYNALDADVKAGISKSGELKEGDQRHIHVIISRCQARENRQVLEKEANQYNREKTTHLCPTVNNKKVFSRDAFIRENEKEFDKKFNYERDLKETYAYCNAVKTGKSEDYNNALEHKNEKSIDKQQNYEHKMQNQQDKTIDLKEQKKQQEKGAGMGY